VRAAHAIFHQLLAYNGHPSLHRTCPHRYWTLTGADQVANMDGFYKNLSIMGGFLLLYVTGAGKYSIDALRSVAAP
jgi:hypothetical protein